MVHNAPLSFTESQFVCSSTHLVHVLLENQTTRQNNFWYRGSSPCLSASPALTCLLIHLYLLQLHFWKEKVGNISLSLCRIRDHVVTSANKLLEINTDLLKSIETLAGGHTHACIHTHGFTLGKAQIFFVFTHSVLEKKKTD